MIDDRSAYIAGLLRHNGAKLPESSTIEFVESGMTHVFRIESPKTWYLKLTPLKEKRSAGAFYPKRLWSPCTQEALRHGAKRRQALRPIIEKVNAKAGEILLVPPYRIGGGEKAWEFTTPGPEKIQYPELADHLVTGWLGIDAVANPHHDKTPYLWHPCSYPAKNLRELALHLKRISDLAKPHLDENLCKILTHERDRYLSYDSLATPFLEALGVSEFSPEEVLEGLEKPGSPVWEQLKNRAEERVLHLNKSVEGIKKELNLSRSASLEEIKNSFYKENEKAFLEGVADWELKRVSKNLRFFHCAFTLEKEGLCSEKTRLLGRRIAQCDITSALAMDILRGDATLVKGLLKTLVKIRPHYELAEKAPKGLVHGGAHPHEFLQDKEGKWTLGGSETLQVGVIYRDIAEEYVRKLVRDIKSGRKKKEESLEKIRAVLVPGWFDEWVPHILGYPVVDFAQELETLFAAYSMNPSVVDTLNLTITPTTYLKEMKERLGLEEYYRTQLYPEL